MEDFPILFMKHWIGQNPKKVLESGGMARPTREEYEQWITELAIKELEKEDKCTHGR